MLKIHEIREIIKMVNESSIQQFEFEQEATKIVIKKQEGVVPQITYETEAFHHASQAEQAVSLSTTNQALVLEVESVSVPTPKAEEQDVTLHRIVSPMVGTFYSAPEPGAEPFVKVGQKIGSDTIVCVLEAMKLFNEIEAGVKGEITEILIKDGQVVEYGQPLFIVKSE